MSNLFHPTALLARATRLMQSLSPQHPIGITTVTRFLHRYLPEYQGVIQVRDGLSVYVDTNNPFERAMFYAGDRHPGATHMLKKHLQPGNYCIDVGANVGFYTLFFARNVGPEGHVAAFEPNPAMKARLITNLQLNHFENVEIVEKAVSQEAGNFTFYINANAEMSSLHRQGNSIDAINVEVITLDSFIAAQNWPRLDAIKIDIEGNDCQAVLSAKQSIERFRPSIVLEYDYDMDAEIADACFNFLLSARYRLVGITIRTGRHIPFNWKRSPSEAQGHINVFCEPIE